MEDGMPSGTSSLPTKSDEEFKPFVRRLPEFKFWHSATRAVCIAFACSWSEIFNLPVFWPVLVVYWLILVFLTMRRQIQSMIKYRYVLLEYSYLEADFVWWNGVLTCAPQIRAMGLWKGQVQGRCKVKRTTLLYDLISLACGFRGKAGLEGLFCLMSTSAWLVVMSGRNLHLIRYMPNAF
jgi:hypothetical protein